MELALQHGAAFLAQDRFSPLREALFARDYAQAAARLDLGESGRLADERASFRIERLQRAAHDRAVEISIEERVEALMESLAKAAEAAKGEFQKIELQVGELAQELLGRAKLFLSDLTVQAQAMAQALEEKQRLAEAEEAANKKAAQAAAAEGEAPGSVD